MATAESSPDAQHCPICGQVNQCAMELAQRTGEPAAPCWCTGVTFTAEVLARIPEALRERACVCKACANQA